MKKISFKNIDISADGYLRCDVIREEAEEFWIKLPFSFNPGLDLVAVMFASLCGTGFDTIDIDLPIGPNLKKILEIHTMATLNCFEGKDRRRKAGEKVAINFSGGFDSLAVKEIYPKADLISLDFGGRFSRERFFFQKFSPYIFETNLVDLKLNKYSWTFMGLGSILLADELNLSTYSFGTVLSASPSTFAKAPIDYRSGRIEPYNFLGLKSLNPVAGLYEIATAKIVLENSTELVADCLNSVALPAEDKYLRKYQMIRAIATTLGQKYALTPPIERPPRMIWGANIATDLSSLYVMKVLGVEEVASTYADGIPNKVIQALPNLDMSIMERFNPHVYKSLTPIEYSHVCQNLIAYGIFPYQRSDWETTDLLLSLVQPTN